VPADAAFRLPQDTGSPPEGRPWWEDYSGDVGLFYLGWGLRYFGRHPQRLTKHSGWPYVVILRGTPTLDLTDRSIRLKRRSALLIHPDCASGWSDREGATSEVLYWIWQHPPDPSLSLGDGGFRLGLIEADHVDRLRLLHHACRREVQIADASSRNALNGLRAQLDDELTRALDPHPPRSDDMLRYTLACSWLERNLARRKAVTLLCEYLEITAPALERLFQKCASSTPAQFLSRLRMRRARDLVINHKMPVKSAAFELGYKHANDLSRAFRRCTGESLHRR
jgi:AraC-like DNA-binding protein